MTTRGAWSDWDEIDRLRDEIQAALEALRLTVEYVGIQTLRPVPGWSWYDVLSRYPEYADWLDSIVNPKPVDTTDEVQHIDGGASDG